MPYQVVCFYVPDMAKDERIIFAMIVLDGERHEIRFIDSWERIDNFAGFSVNLLKSLAKEEWTSDDIKNFLNNAGGSIQFSERKGTLRPFDEAITDAVNRYLKPYKLSTSELTEEETVISPEGAANFRRYLLAQKAATKRGESLYPSDSFDSM